ncbi:MAG: Na+/H+ antiporter subunit E [Oscillospiraceae bacterium]|nr:Na+/H+ antiporter subunit E [Oscillospiraceae bacterium]
MLVLLFLAWIIFNGRITLEIVIFGIVIAAAVFAFMCKFMDYSIKKELRLYKKVPEFLKYVFLLVKEIIKANMAVIKMILTRREVTEPTLVKVHTDLKSETAKVMLANSITLTPGTITVSMEGDTLLVHCLDKSLSEGMEDSDFVKMLEKMEGEK